MTPGWSLEPAGNDGPRGMVTVHRTRLTDLSAGRAFLRYELRCLVAGPVGDLSRSAARLARSWPALSSRFACVIPWTGAMDQRSPVHEIVNALWRALHDLGSPATTGEIERWGLSLIHISE